MDEQKQNSVEPIREKPVLRPENVTDCFESRFIKVFDLSYEPGKHYFNATRRKKEDLTAMRSDREFREMLPDAVSCVVILRIKGSEPLLCLSREFRFPVGQFLLSIPAGLIDEEDRLEEAPVFCAAVRELQEETGILLEPSDEIKMINPLLFSSPGMTDESNAVVQILLNREELPGMTQDGAVDGEYFNGFLLVDREKAMELLKRGTDEQGIFYSVYTWIALMWFVSGMWDYSKSKERLWTE